MNILMYHSIGICEDKNNLTPVQFENQLKYFIDEGYYFVNPNDFNCEYDHKAIYITFDDGHVSFFNYGAEILSKYKIPAINFLIPGKIISGHENIMNESQIIQLSKFENIFFGSHTFNHIYNPKLLPIIMAEILEAKIYLNHLTNNVVNNQISWPFGYSSSKMRNIAISSGYKYQFSAYSGNVSLIKDEIILPRLKLDGINANNFIEKFESSNNKINKLISCIKYLSLRTK